MFFLVFESVFLCPHIADSNLALSNASSERSSSKSSTDMEFSRFFLLLVEDAEDAARLDRALWSRSS